MRSRRTTYLLLFLAFAFIMTIIILCLLPTENESTHHRPLFSQKIIADLPEDTKVTTSTEKTLVVDSRRVIKPHYTSSHTTKSSTTKMEILSTKTMPRTTTTDVTPAKKETTDIPSTISETRATTRKISKRPSTTPTEPPETTKYSSTIIEATTTSKKTTKRPSTTITEYSLTITEPATTKKQTTKRPSTTTTESFETTEYFLTNTEPAATKKQTTKRSSTTTSETPATTEYSSPIIEPATTTKPTTKRISSITTETTEYPSMNTELATTKQTSKHPYTATRETPETTEYSSTIIELAITTKPTAKRTSSTITELLETTEYSSTNTEPATKKKKTITERPASTTTKLSETTTEYFAENTTYSSTTKKTTEPFLNIKSTTQLPSTITQILPTESSPATSMTTTTSQPVTTIKSTTPVKYHHKMFEQHKAETRRPCTSADCKKVASKMLDSMDHTAEYCEDFYQYSCGGVEADPFLLPEDPEVTLDAIIKEELFKNGGEASTFYESCRNFRSKKNTFNSHLLEANEENNLMFGEPFRTLSSSDLLSLFMKQNIPLFFDVSVEPCSGQKYCPRLSLSFSTSSKIGENICMERFASNVKDAKITKILNLNDEHKVYQDCTKKTETIGARIAKLNGILTNLETSHLNLTDEISVILSDLEDALHEYQKLLIDFHPSKVMTEIADQKNFQLMMIKELEDKEYFNEFINWKEFLADLGLNITHNPQIRMYHMDLMARLFVQLQKLERAGLLRDLLTLLWIENFHNTFELSEHPESTSSDECLQLTKQLMPLHIQALFLKHLNSSTLHRLQTQIDEIGRVAMNEITVASMNSGLENVSVELANSNITFLEYKIKENNKFFEATLADHVTNVIKLNEIVRKNNYELLAKTEVNTQDDIFLLKNQEYPFQQFDSKLLVPPTSVVDSTFLDDHEVPNYIKFDHVTHYIVYSLLKKLKVSDLDISGSNSSECVRIEASNTVTAQYEFNISATYKLPSGNQSVAYEFDATTLGWKVLRHFETIAGSSSTLDLEVSHDRSLIWFESTPLSPIKTYFIRKTQMACRASNELQILQTIEQSRMPSRQRVNILLKYEPLFSQVFNCSDTSGMNRLAKPCPAIEVPIKMMPPISN